MDELKAHHWLFEVEEVFDTQAGLFVVCDLELLKLSGAVVRVGDALTFLCGGERRIETHVQQLPMISRPPGQPRSDLTPIELPRTEETLQISAGDQAFRRL